MAHRRSDVNKLGRVCIFLLLICVETPISLFVAEHLSDESQPKQVTFTLDSILTQTIPTSDKNSLLFCQNHEPNCYGINYFTQIYYHVRHSRRCYSKPIDLSFYSRILIIGLSGDIALNPGPPKHPCGVCGRAVA